MSIPAKTIYKTTNWHDYNRALKQRGSLTVWFDPAMVWEAEPTGKHGRQPTYSDGAIQACLTLKVLFGMAPRQMNDPVPEPARSACEVWNCQICSFQMTGLAKVLSQTFEMVCLSRRL